MPKFPPMPLLLLGATGMAGEISVGQAMGSLGQASSDAYSVESQAGKSYVTGRASTSLGYTAATTGRAPVHLQEKTG